MFLDLDHFKDINDTLGHSIGDALLVELAKRPAPGAANGRYRDSHGRDEFILLLPGINAIGAAHVAQKLLDAIAESYLIGLYDLALTASIGIALYPEDGRDLGNALQKRRRPPCIGPSRKAGNATALFTQEMQARSARNLQLVNALHHALERNQLHVYYQPQVAFVRPAYHWSGSFAALAAS